MKTNTHVYSWHFFLKFSTRMKIIKYFNFLLYYLLYYTITIIQFLAHIRKVAYVYFPFLLAWNSFLYSKLVSFFESKVCFMEAVVNDPVFWWISHLLVEELRPLMFRVIGEWCTLISATSLYLLYFLRPPSINFPDIVLIPSDIWYIPFDSLIWSGVCGHKSFSPFVSRKAFIFLLIPVDILFGIIVQGSSYGLLELVIHFPKPFLAL